jgi:hypothetical protein
MGIRVVGGDGSPIRPGASFLRNLLRFADGFFFLYLIAFICMAVSPGFRRLGDWAGDTLVIYTAYTRLSGHFSPALDTQRTIPWLSQIPGQIPGQKLDFEKKQALLMFARRYPLLGKDRADEIAHPWAVRLRGNYNDASKEALKEPSTVSDSEYLLGIARSISGAL